MEPTMLIAGGASALALGAADFVASRTAARIGALRATLGMLVVGAVGLILFALSSTEGRASLAEIGLHQAWYAALHGVAGAAGLAAFFHAMTIGGVSLPAMIMAGHPVFVLGVYWAGSGLPEPAGMLPAGLILAGLALLLSQERGHGGAISQVSRSAVSWAMLGSALYAVSVLALQSAAASGTPAATMLVGRVSGAALLLTIVFARRTKAASAGRPSWETIGLVLLHGVLDLAGFLFLVLGTQAGNNPAAVALLSALFPAVTVLMGIVLGGDRIGQRAVLGFALVLCGAAAVTAH